MKYRIQEFKETNVSTFSLMIFSGGGGGAGTFYELLATGLRWELCDIISFALHHGNI